MAFMVWHGGKHFGLGRWSGPHATRAEAEDSADACRKIIGGDPIIEEEGSITHMRPLTADERDGGARFEHATNWDIDY